MVEISPDIAARIKAIAHPQVDPLLDCDQTSIGNALDMINAGPAMPALVRSLLPQIQDKDIDFNHKGTWQKLDWAAALVAAAKWADGDAARLKDAPLSLLSKDEKDQYLNGNETAHKIFWDIEPRLEAELAREAKNQLPHIHKPHHGGTKR